MHFQSRSFKTLICFAILLIGAVGACAVRLSCNVAGNPDPLYITAATNKLAYYIREQVNILGNFTKDGSSVSPSLVALEVQDPQERAYSYRTITIGTPGEAFPLIITEALVVDWATGNPIDSAQILTSVKLKVTVYNPQGIARQAVITVTVYDGNMIPLHANSNPISIGSGGTRIWTDSLYIPEWAYSGKATVYFNVYSDYPKNRGIPYAAEESIQFHITRNSEVGLPYSPPTNPDTTLPGKYSTILRVSPDRFRALPGTYTVYVTGRESPWTGATANGDTTFSVLDAPSPPQAAFTYNPSEPYINQTVEFDASSSSAEGYNDTIISYEWDFGDGTPKIMESDPIIEHNFEQAQTFIVTLNVTDKEGLWSTTSKPITMLPEFGPTAYFTWSPMPAIVNGTVTFDASDSTLGWSAKTQRFSPIDSYVWNFSDGTSEVTVHTPTLDHIFTEPGNFTVTLTVIDSETPPRSDTTSHIVEVLNITLIGDITGEIPWVPDCKVNIRDIALVASKFGCEEGEPCYDVRADLAGGEYPERYPNPDGKINIRDIALVATHFGETC